MKSNLFAKTLLLTFIATLLASCTAMQPAPKTLPPIRVEFSQWWGDYIVLVAKEKGFFEKRNVNVEPVYYKIFSDSYSDLAAGQIDVALIAVGDVMNINSHTPIKVIGLVDDGGYTPIVARPEIGSIQDLRGKTVGMLVGTQYELLLVDMLASVGMTRADITIRNINPEESIPALLRNEVQATFLWEPFTSQAIKAGGHVLYPTDNTLRLFPNTIAFRQSVIDQRPEEIKAFMEAWFEAVDYSLQNPLETRQIAAKYTGIPLENIEPDRTLKTYTYEDNLALYSEFSDANDSIFKITQKTADYLIASGTLSVIPDIKEIITADYLSQTK